MSNNVDDHYRIKNKGFYVKAYNVDQLFTLNSEKLFSAFVYFNLKVN